MTDGIIQEVIRDFIQHELDNLPWEIRDLRILEQILIERIKQELDYDKNCHCYHCDNTRKLIGDNE